MKLRRKGMSIAFTATLLSSLLMTIAAPIVLGLVTVTSAGNVPRGGTSAGTATFQFTENAVGCFDSAPLPAGNELNVQITDFAGASTVHFVGTPTVVAPGSLGAVTATLSHHRGVQRHPQHQLDELIAVRPGAGHDQWAPALGRCRGSHRRDPRDALRHRGAVRGPADHDGDWPRRRSRHSLPERLARSAVVDTTSPCPAFVITGTVGPLGGVAGNLTFVTNAETKAITAAPSSGRLASRP